MATIPELVPKYQKLNAAQLAMSSGAKYLEAAQRKLISSQKDLPKFLQPISKSVTSSLSQGAQFSHTMKNMGPAVQQAVGGIGEFMKSFKSISGAGGGFLVILMELWKLFRRGIEITAKFTQNMGVFSTMLPSLKSVAGVMWDFNFALDPVSAGLRDTENMIALVGKSFASGLYPMGKMRDGFREASVETLKMANKLDFYAKGLGSTFEAFSKRALGIATTLNLNLEAGGEQAAQTIMSHYQYLNNQAIKNVGVPFDAIQDMSANLFRRISYTSTQQSGVATRAIINMLATVRSGFELANKNQTLNNQKMLDLAKMVTGAMEDSTWDMYYGVLATQGKLTGSFQQGLAKSFDATPVQKFMEQFKFMKTITKDVSQLGPSWLHFTGMFKDLPAENVTKLGAALERIDPSQLTDWANGIPDNVVSQLQKAGLDARGIENLQKTFEVTQDPMKFIMNILQKMYDLLGVFTGKFFMGGANSNFKPR